MDMNRRDTSSGTTDDVDVAAVNQLLGERLLARKKGDFGIADQIRDQLSAEHKVTVFDQDKVWVTGGLVMVLLIEGERWT